MIKPFPLYFTLNPKAREQNKTQKQLTWLYFKAFSKSGFLLSPHCSQHESSLPVRLEILFCNFATFVTLLLTSYQGYTNQNHTHSTKPRLSGEYMPHGRYYGSKYFKMLF